MTVATKKLVEVDLACPSKSRPFTASKLSSSTDFTIPIYPRHITAILQGEKDHEYRKYKLPTQHMWIYETAPVSAVRYYAAISAGKTSSEMADHFTNIKRNRVFNESQSAVQQDTTVLYAHEIKEFYQLKTPMTIKQIKEKGCLASHPQGLCWVPDEMKASLSKDMIRVK